MPQRLAVLAVIGAAVLFGTTGTAQALGPDGTTPLGVGTMRILAGSAVLWLLARRRPHLLQVRPHLGVILIGALGVAVYQPGFFLGTERSGVALGTIVALGSGPLFAGVLQWSWLGRRPSRVWAVATAVMIAGGVLVVFGRSGEATLSLLGMTGSLAAGFGYALYALTTKRLIESGLGSTEALAWQFSIGTLLLLPFLVGQPLDWVTTPSGILLVVHLGVFATGLAYYLYGWGLRSLTTSTAVTLTLAEPVTAAVAAVVILEEQLHWYGWIGVAVVCTGLFMIGSEPVREPVDPRAAVSGPLGPGPGGRTASASLRNGHSPLRRSPGGPGPPPR